MHDFRRLRHLRLPIELIQCNIDAASLCESTERCLDETLADDLVPGTVQIFSTPSPQTNGQKSALKTMVSSLRGMQRSNPLPALKDLYVCSFGDLDTTDYAQYESLRTEAEKLGVMLHVG
jgi:hypothetical protein